MPAALAQPGEEADADQHAVSVAATTRRRAGAGCLARSVVLRMPHVGLRACPDEPERARLRDAEGPARAPRARPGEKVSLHELASSLGVSRSPVHHALTRLVAEGLLTVKSRRGYYVTALTKAAIEEGYDVRLALELQAAESAVGRVACTRPAPPARAA